MPWQEIKRMVENGQISASPEVPESQIQPASIDLRLGKEAYRVQASFLRGRSATLLTKVQELLDSTIDLTQAMPPLLEPGVVYIIPLLERLRLPNDVQGIANPKSTTGRLDVFTRLITEHGDQFDRVPKGYKGLLYVEVSSRTFPIRVRAGMKLNQLRFVRGNSLDPIRNGELRQLAKEQHLLYDSEGRPTTDRIGEGIELTVDLEGDNNKSVVAYRAKDSPRAIELDKVDHYDPADYWEAIPRPRQGHIILAKGGFYLLASKGRVSVPLDHAAEMMAHDPSLGEFRVHYAGFFDPGFGYGSKKGEICGTKAVLEVRAYEVPILLEDDDVVGRLHYYPMAAIPDKVYGTSIGSSYQQQGLALSKQFKRPAHAESTALGSATVLSPPALVG
ncbi:2'-deoxycytidine 5'-triphosphate deaminase [Candidatus Sulfotelmatobacter sp. SbA7]|nr:2'-deoxycytidine 5'-triphosphate deaminase [Candidatus Sulfotelmatobacter sp. SbA7]